jgi:peptidoglycan/LPS O-acetylase OafA/YrhL
MSSAAEVSLSTVPELAPTRSAASASSVRNARLQYLRAAAATAVVLYHASIHLQIQRGESAFMAVFDGRFGLYGVAIFFAISGYLMAKLVRSGNPWLFLAHRVLRIYPIYLITIVLGALAYVAAGIPFGVDPLALTLVPLGERGYPLGVEWTLVFEVTYYVLLALMVRAGLQRFLEPIAFVWILAILAVSVFAPALQRGGFFPLYLLLLSPVNVAFAGGLLVPFLHSRGLLPKAGWLIVLPLALTTDFFGLETNRWIAGLAAVFVVGWATRDREPRTAIRPFIALGDWSYALYLCHVPVILIVYRLWPSGSGIVAAWPLALVLAFIAASVLGPLDVRLYRILKRWSDAAAPGAIRFLSVGFAAVFLGIGAVASLLILQDRVIDGRIQATLRTLGRPALVDQDSVAARIAATGLSLPGSLMGRFDEWERLPSGQIAVRGWAVDRDDPSKAFRMHAYCDRTLIGSRLVSRRKRPDLVGTLGRSDLHDRRIGYTIVSDRAPACQPEAKVFILAFDESGRVGVLDGPNQQPGAK